MNADTKLKTVDPVSCMLKNPHSIGTEVPMLLSGLVSLGLVLREGLTSLHFIAQNLSEKVRETIARRGTVHCMCHRWIAVNVDLNILA